MVLPTVPTHLFLSDVPIFSLLFFFFVIKKLPSCPAQVRFGRIKSRRMSMTLKSSGSPILLKRRVIRAFRHIRNHQRSTSMASPCLLHRSAARQYSSTCTAIVREQSSFSGSSHRSSSATAHQYRHHHPSNLIVVGTGVAGCSTALIAAERYSIPVTLICAGSTPMDCNSYWAQGGIIYPNYNAASSTDSVDSLMADIFRAGDGLCNADAVRKLAVEGPHRVKELLLGNSPSFANVPFERDTNGKLKVCLEASHSAPRIIYRADHSGRAITEHIVQAALKHPLIHVVTDTVVTDLILSNNACIGATVFDKLSKTHSSIFSSVGVTLASGGLAGIYTHSTNPPGFNALGSSTALAVRANVTVADLEFVQFHPTALCIPDEPCFLLTEALRGEGAKLVTADGHAFAKTFHPMGELAPRDIVARGVYAQSQLSGRVYLDITHRDAQWLRQRFPSIQEKVLQYGLDITKDKLPITPAAHYTCGGIVSDSNGCTSVQNLYVAGEAARTGLHGGNRLASTSLLEALVWGSSTAEYIGGNEQSKSVQDWARHEIHNFVTDHCEATARVNATNAKEGSFGLLSSNNRASKREEEERASTLLHQLKSVMWDNVGVVRSKSGLEEACSTILDIQKEADELYFQQHRLTTSLESIMIRDASYAGLAVATSAIQNSQSRGSHYLAEESCETDDEQQVAASL